MIIDDIFDIKNARSMGFEDHDSGAIAFISNGLENNGVVGFVSPIHGERIFRSTAICVSAFCEATVQQAPFLPRGNGGSGLVVLIPKEPMTDEELYFYAGIINLQRWRFSFGRMVTGDRIKNVKVRKAKPSYSIAEYKSRLLPKPIQRQRVAGNFKLQSLDSLFDVKKGEGYYYEDCKPGKVPLVSATGGNNGIIGFIDEKPLFKAPMITIERVSGNAFVQLDDFITVPDDIFVLKPKQEFTVAELFYFAAMINTQKWRFNYSRKVTPIRLKKLLIPVPKVNASLDESAIERIVQNSYGWSAI